MEHFEMKISIPWRTNFKKFQSQVIEEQNLRWRSQIFCGQILIHFFANMFLKIYLQIIVAEQKTFGKVIVKTFICHFRLHVIVYYHMFFGNLFSCISACLVILPMWPFLAIMHPLAKKDSKIRQHGSFDKRDPVMQIILLSRMLWFGSILAPFL